MRFRKESYIKQTVRNGKWYFEVRVPDCSSKTFSESKYGTARIAFDNAVRYRNECLIPGSTAHKNTQSKTLEQVFDESIELFPVREKTKKTSFLLLNKYIGDTERPIGSITRAEIISSLNDMIMDCSNDTIGRVLALWRKLFKTAVINEYVTNDLTVGLVAPKSQRIETNVHKEVVTTRETLDGVKEKIMEYFASTDEAEAVCIALEVMWYTGLRPAECFALSVNDIKGGYISVDKELGSDIADSGYIDRKNFNIIRKCKTQASIRKVPIPSKLQQILNGYTPKHPEILFPNKNGGYFDTAQLGQRIKRLGIPFNMYQLRHTVATKLVTSGIDQRTIIEILGHESITMSVYYARSNEERKKNALEDEPE